MSKLESLSEKGATVRIAAGLFSPRFTRDIESQRSIYKGFLAEGFTLPVNVEEDLLNSVTGVVEQRDLKNKKIDYTVPYWDSDMRYDPFQMFGTLIQYIDFHDEKLPKTVLPPEKDVSAYIERILEAEGPQRIPQQLELLLNITGDNIVGAANLGFIASRLVARTYDKSAYPGIDVSPSVSHEWNRKIAQFEVYERGAQIDGPGDNYYFWTHLFASLGYAKQEGKAPQVFSAIFSKGTPVMRFVRDHVARRPTLSRHEEASILGRNLGLAIAGMV